MNTTIPATLTPRGEALVCSAPGWAEEIVISRVASCQLYNMIEPAFQWHPVIADWENCSTTQEGWRLPCRVDIPFVATVITFELLGRYRADLQAMELSIPADTLVEIDPVSAKLLRIDLLPDFAAAHAGDDGYLLLPCLSGALHNFKHSVSREARVTIYAQQEQWAMKSNYNCIGMQHSARAWCGIMTEGEFDAEAVIRSHFDEDAGYSIHFGFVYRWEYTDDLLPGTRTARYYLLDPAAGGWPAFAHCYRRFLREERGVRTWAQKRADHPKLAHFAHGFLLKIMQGYKRPQLDGHGEYLSATSFSEARTILERMQADGIKQITAQMVGWNIEGHDGRYPTRFPVNPVEGGEEAFRDLIAWGHKHEVVVSVHDNYSDSYVNGDDFSYDDVIVLRDGRKWRNAPWAGGFNWRICPLQSMRHAQRDLPRMKELGISGNYYLDAVAAICTCHSPNHAANRQQMFEGFRAIFSYVRELFGTLSTEVPFGIYYDLMDGVYIEDSYQWLERFTDFGAHFIDDLQPFLPVVLHNSIRYQRHSDSRQGRVGALRTLAWGAMPFIEISARKVAHNWAMPNYDELAEYANAGYQLCCEEFGDLIEQDLENIKEITRDVFITSYAGGVRLFINATEAPVSIEGTPLSPLTALRVPKGEA